MVFRNGAIYTVNLPFFSDKTKACSDIIKDIELFENVHVTSCEIECCTTDMCNVDLKPTFPPNGDGSSISVSPVVFLAAFAIYFGF